MAGQNDVETNYTTVYNDEENTRIIAEMTAKMIGERQDGPAYGNKGNLVSDLRQKGYYAGMEKYPNITVVENSPPTGDPPTGMKAAQDLIAANPDLKAIHCISDAVTLAVYQAVKTAGKEGGSSSPAMTSNDDALKAVESGQFTSSSDRRDRKRPAIGTSRWRSNWPAACARRKRYLILLRTLL